jgi:hypothetical protein
VSVDVFSYPPPVITPRTLRFAINDPTGGPVTDLTGSATSGQNIYFDGANFGTAVTSISVTYGTAGSYSCVLLDNTGGQGTTDTRIACKTQLGAGTVRFLICSMCVHLVTQHLCSSV